MHEKYGKTRAGPWSLGGWGVGKGAPRAFTHPELIFSSPVLVVVVKLCLGLPHPSPQWKLHCAGLGLGLWWCVWLRVQRGAACGTGHHRTGSVGLHASRVLDMLPSPPIPPPPHPALGVTGQESYVHAKLEEKDVSFFPLNKAMDLPAHVMHPPGKDPKEADQAPAPAPIEVPRVPSEFGDRGSSCVPHSRSRSCTSLMAPLASFDFGKEEPSGKDAKDEGGGMSGAVKWR